ncbi:MAG TPA: hypothetical protein VKI65_18050 [Gemmataceae bacterium]|nr:hypothetical protein [Gemmataceae bacterium]
MPKCLLLAVTAMFLYPVGVLSAAEEEKIELLPMPAILAPDCLPCEEMPGSPLYYRTSAYDVWQFYGVDRQGRFRLRVINAPEGPYYLVNGVPYWYASIKQLDFMPYVVD